MFVSSSLATTVPSACMSVETPALGGLSPAGAAYMDDRHRTVVPHLSAKVDFDDIFRLFTHRHTAQLFKRQAASFRQIAREKKAGLTMADIDPVCRVVQLGLERLPESEHTLRTDSRSSEAHPHLLTAPVSLLVLVSSLSREGLPVDVFLKPLCSLIRLFGLPFLTSKAFEELQNQESITLVLSVLVKALGSNECEMIHAVSQTIMAFTSKRTAREFNSRCDIVAQSGMVEALVLCMQRNAGDLATALPLVSACRHLATLRRVASQFDSRVFGVLVDLLEVREFRAPLVLEVVQLLWLVMDLTDTPATEAQKGTTIAAAGKTAMIKSAALLSTHSAAVIRSNSAASIRAFVSLRSVSVIAALLRQAFASGYRNTDKQIRNDLVVLLVLLSREESARKLLAEVGILDELQQHATYTEMKLLQQGATAFNGTATLAPSSTVGLGKIRALRSTTGGLSAASFTLTQDFFTVSEDFQLRLLVWHLASNCASDPSCHSVLLQSTAGASEPSDLMQVLLLYLDTAEAFNAHQLTLAQQAVQAGKTMQSQQALMANTAALQAVPSPIANSASFAAASLLIARLSFSQLLHLQSEALRALSALVPHSYEVFTSLGGLGRVLGFLTAVMANPSGNEDKRLNANQALALQGQALGVLLRAMQAGRALGAPCALTVSAGGTLTTFGAFDATPPAQTDSAVAPTSPTAIKPNAALQELLDPAHDEAFEAVMAAMASPTNDAATSNGRTQKFGTPAKTRTGTGFGAAMVGGNDAAQVLTQLLALFADATKPASTRSDALSIVSLLVARNPALQRVLRQVKGVHILAQFLSNDGPAVARANMGATGLLPGARPAATPAPNSNLAVHASMNPALLISVVDALWSGIIGVAKSEQLFLALNGLDLVLDLLVLVGAPQRKQVLGFLSDLLANPLSHQYLFEWQASRGAKLPADQPVSLVALRTAESERSGAISPMSSASGSLSSVNGSATSAGLTFTALELLLSFWPSASLLERNEKQLAGHLRFKPTTINGSAPGSPLPPGYDAPEEDSDAEENERRGPDDGEEEEKQSESARGERYRNHVASTAASASNLARVSSNQHLKPALYAIFSRLGFAGVDSNDESGSDARMNPFVSRATPVQRATLFEISRYVDELRATTLLQIETKLREQDGLNIVESDTAFLRANAEHLDALRSTSSDFDAAAWGSYQSLEKAAIDHYLWQLTSRKEQQEAFMIANARRTKKQTMRRRLLYKEMRQQMLRNSNGPTADTNDAHGSAAAAAARDTLPKTGTAILTEQKSQLSLQQQAFTLQQEQQREEDDEDIEVSAK